MLWIVDCSECKIIISSDDDIGVGRNVIGGREGCEVAASGVHSIKGTR